LTRSPSGRVGANKGSHGLIAWSIQLHEKGRYQLLNTM
jgi:hypothetical protein